MCNVPIDCMHFQLRCLSSCSNLMKADLALVFIGSGARVRRSAMIYISLSLFGFKQPSEMFSAGILAARLPQHLAEGLECFKHSK